MRILRSVIHSRKARIGVIAGVTAASVLLIGAPAYAAVPMTLSQSLGPAAGTNTISATIVATSTMKFTTATNVQFQGTTGSTTPTCTAASTTPNNTLTFAAAKVSYISASRIGITVPNVSASAASKFAVCAYAGAPPSSTLIANGVYTATAPPTISSISPAAAPSQGGTLVTVTGTRFPATCASSAGISATIGGTPMTGITCISANQFQGIAPAHAPGTSLPLVVNTTANGSATLLGAFTYQNGIVVTPSYAPNTKSTDIFIQGVGFSGMTFNDTSGNDPDSTDAHVYLVAGSYNGANGGSGYKANAEVTECINVLPIGDTELICTMVASHQFTPATAGEPIAFATRSVAGTTSNTPDELNATTDADLTAADIGRAVIAGTGLGATPRTITAVATGTGSLSGAVTTPGTATFTLGQRVIAATVDTTTTSGVTKTTAPTFFPADVGRTVTGAGIPLGTMITAVDGSGNATFTPTLAVDLVNATVSVGDPVPVTDGTYTVTVVSNGAMGAASPSVSVISSGSTFTIAAFN
jgi:hypothetical protein